MRFEISKDAANEWRWKLIVNRGGKTIAESGEGYKNLTHAQNMISKIRVNCHNATIVLLDN